jgi:hypothetical protein
MALCENHVDSFFSHDAGYYPGIPAHFCTKLGDFLTDIRILIERNDKVGMSELSQYPLSVQSLNPPYADTEINNPSEFIQHYDEIITPELRSELEDQNTLNVGTVVINSEGEMLTSNGIWARDNIADIIYPGFPR